MTKIEHGKTPETASKPSPLPSSELASQIESFKSLLQGIQNQQKLPIQNISTLENIEAVFIRRRYS